MPFEKRIAPRARTHPKEPVEIQLMSERFLDIFEARDISTTGAGILVPYRFEGCALKNPVDLVITLPGRRPFRTVGRIVHRTKTEREFFGVEFVGLPLVQVREIERYVKRRLAEDAEAASEESDSTTGVGEGSRRRILIAEDEPNVRLLVRTTLEGRNYEVVEAEDGSSALELARREKLDLLVLDWMMPEQTGVEVLKTLREDPQTANLPAIMLTARAQAGDRETAIRLGIRGYLTKPFSPSELLDLVEKVLEGARVTA